jgi:hypothetical protein
MTITLILMGSLVVPISDEPVSVKNKDGVVVVKTKSKPVRKALEAQYAKLARAVENKDHAAFQALRTADFHTVDEHGRKQTPQQMSDRARAMLASIQPPIKVTNTIGTIDVQGNDAKATVRQYFAKMLPVAGKLRKVETYVTQEETWTKMPDGWKLKFVDGVRDGEYYVDGKRMEPGKPYDPDAPAFDPKAPTDRGPRR